MSRKNLRAGRIGSGGSSGLVALLFVSSVGLAGCSTATSLKDKANAMFSPAADTASEVTLTPKDFGEVQLDLTIPPGLQEGDSPLQRPSVPPTPKPVLLGRANEVATPTDILKSAKPYEFRAFADNSLRLAARDGPVGRARAKRSSAEALSRIPRSSLLPEINAFARTSIGSSASNNSSGGQNNRSTAGGGAQLRWTIAPWSSIPKIESADLALMSSDLQLTLAINDHLYTIVRLWTEVMFAREQVMNARDRLDTQNNLLSIARSSVAAGISESSALLAAEAAKEGAERDLLEKKMALQRADIEFFTTTRYEVPDTLEEPMLVDPGWTDLSATLDLIKTSSPILAKNATDYRKFEADRRAAKAEGLGSVSVTTDIEAGKNIGQTGRKSDIGAGVSYTVPIFDFGRSSARIAAATADAIDARIARDESVRRVEATVRQAWVALAEGPEIIRRAREELQKKQSLLRLYQLQVQTKGRSIGDVVSLANDITRLREQESGVRYAKILAIGVLGRESGYLADWIGVQDAVAEARRKANQNFGVFAAWKELLSSYNPDEEP